MSTSGRGSRPKPEIRGGETRDLIVESDIVVDFLKGTEGARSALEEASDMGVLYLSAVSAAEVMAASSEEMMERTKGLIASFVVVPVDGEVALLAGRYFIDGGRDEPGLDDCIVAATCERMAAVLMTHGRRRYPAGRFETMAVDY